MSVPDNNIIKASPTKDLFITMLTRDLTLRDAIGDLVDNSVDGAKVSSSEAEAPKYDGFKIDITANDSEFKIIDNCGGIEVEQAKNYAFRFGRPKDKPTSPGSVGQFGIGMKRSLFKLGKKFVIKSISPTSSFQMTVNVAEWQKNEDNWDFVFDSLIEGEENDVSLRKTEIVVSDLNYDVKEQFKDSKFLSTLVKEIEMEHMYNISQGLKIKLNGSRLKSRSLSLIESDEFKSASWEKEFNDGDIKVKAVVGIEEADLAQGGWYIFCNDRLIVGPEQTELSGWTGNKGDGGPNYHHQFCRFRGYIFFQADDSSKLPWNTTKNGMDRDSPLFKQVRQQMIELMKPVITFLNNIKKEREKGNQDRPLEQSINSATSVVIAEIKPASYSNKFSFPTHTVKIEKGPSETQIKYVVSTERANKVKKMLGAKSYRDIGLETFNYYFESEIG
ncbi:MAG: ATP-binding protein [Crocinitomicaceae bacterium]|nr:ATP-binding protein [Crocinitomicaceae bacterium]